MITILHGENQAASRKELDQIRSEFSGEIIWLEGATLTETDFIQATQSQAMFTSQKLVIIEGLPKFDLAKADCDVVIWVNKKITPPKDIPAKEFKVPQTIWKFLDHPTVPLFRESLKTNDGQFLFLMLVRKYRLEGNGEKLKKLLEIDYQFKQGLLPGDLPLALELFLLDL